MACCIFLSSDHCEIAPISAMSNVFVRFFSWIYSFFWKEEMEITLVGLNNSGKTSFVNVISSGHYSEEMIPTIGFQMRRVTKGNVAIKMWDLGGQKRFRSMWGRYCRGVDVIVFMLDAADELNLKQATEELRSLVYQPQLTGIPLLILGNKSDIPGALDDRQLIELMNLTVIDDREVCIFSTSCKEKQNVDQALQWIVKHRRSQRK